MSPYRTEPSRAAVPPLGGGVLTPVAWLVLGLAAFEIVAVVSTGAAWGVEPTLALIALVMSARALLDRLGAAAPPSR